MSVLGEDGATNDEEVKGRSNASSRSVEGVSSTKFDSRGRKDSHHRDYPQV